MTALELLTRARDADRQASELWERVERARARLEGGRRASVTGMPRGGARDWTEDADSLIELERRIARRVRGLMALKRRAAAVIMTVRDPRQREVLERYYLDGMRWSEVGARMGLTARHAKRLRWTALRHVRMNGEDTKA